MISGLASLLIVLPLFVGGATTKVYKCQRGDEVIFSQFPCDKQAKQIDITVQQNQSVTPSNTKYASELDDVVQYVEQETTARKISHHERAIERYKQQLAVEFAQLKDKRYRTSEDKAKAIKALSDKFNKLIVREHEAIKNLSRLSKK